MSSSKPALILVTGAAGFIGFHLSRKLDSLGHRVIGIDNLNTYYDLRLKNSRLENLLGSKNFSFHQLDLTDKKAIDDIFEAHQFSHVINLAAQAGVRYSLTNPYAYLESNLHGFLNILEACRTHQTGHLVFASSSSVYGSNKTMPFSESNNVDHPLALYAASKKANELMAHSYSHLYQLPVTGLRFFTVYGPYGRPDMALFIFTKAILEGKPIDIYNFGKMRRDFTYIDDIVEGIIRVMRKAPERNSNWDAFHPDPASSSAPYRIYNIGNNQPVELLRFIKVLEEKLGRKATKNFLPLQNGDVAETFADISRIEHDFGFRPLTSIEDGIGEFVKWYKEYHKID